MTDHSPKGNEPTIIFVPGKNPKPPPDEHRQALWRCLLDGVARVDATASDRLACRPHCFELAAWNALFYDATKCMANDLPWIEAARLKPGPGAVDRREARAWRVAWARMLFNLADLVPALIRWVPDPAVRGAIRETARYFANRNGVADRIRETLKTLLRGPLNEGAPVLVIGHSLGSVIAYDALWELSHRERLAGAVDRFVTIGSPLGSRFVQHRLLGAWHEAHERYPTNIKRWTNISAVGDLTALDRRLANDFREMRESGCLLELTDYSKDVYNWFRDEKGLNVHRSYGYLVNPAVGRVVATWLQECCPP